MTTTDPNNRVPPDIPPDDGQVIEGHVSALEQMLGKYGADLGTQDRRRFSRAGDGGAVYVKKSLVVAPQLPGGVLLLF